MDAELRQRVKERAAHRCEYCRLRQRDEDETPFHVEHITARQHGGTDDGENLALACCWCNALKGPNLSGLDPDTSAQTPEGTRGEVVGTYLHNYAMPFVRYLNGDAATYGTRRCACGRGLPLLESVDGRVLDVILTPDGRHILGEFFVYVMLGLAYVRQYQVVQDVIDELEMKIVADRPLTEDERRFITDKIATHTGRAMRIKISEVSSIPLTPSGKRRVTISNLKKT